MSIMGEILQEILGKFLNSVFKGMFCVVTAIFIGYVVCFMVSLFGVLAGEAGSLGNTIWSALLGCGSYWFLVTDLQHRFE